MNSYFLSVYTTVKSRGEGGASPVQRYLAVTIYLYIFRYILYRDPSHFNLDHAKKEIQSIKKPLLLSKDRSRGFTLTNER
jgi:hypothetical protein